MITAIDANVLLDVLLSNPDFCDAAMESLQASATAGSLGGCDSGFTRTLRPFLDPGTVATSFSRQLRFESSLESCRAFRRQVACGASIAGRRPRVRILADFWSAPTPSFKRAATIERPGASTKLFPSLKPHRSERESIGPNRSNPDVCLQAWHVLPVITSSSPTAYQESARTVSKRGQRQFRERPGLGKHPC